MPLHFFQNIFSVSNQKYKMAFLGDGFGICENWDRTSVFSQEILQKYDSLEDTEHTEGQWRSGLCWTSCQKVSEDMLIVFFFQSGIFSKPKWPQPLFTTKKQITNFFNGHKSVYGEDPLVHFRLCSWRAADLFICTKKQGAAGRWSKVWGSI